MWNRLILGILLAVAAYYVVKTFSVDESFTNWDTVVETPGSAPPTREPPTRGDLNMASGGPNSPNAAAPRRMPPTAAPGATASDPYAETAEEADAPEHLTHPERNFSPGIVPEQTAIAESAGLAGAVSSSSQAFQSFSPDFVQNGGSFFGTVSAFEDENPNYTSF
jgi:hypothetical protein